MWLIPLVATGIAAVFAGMLVRQFLARRGQAQLLWRSRWRCSRSPRRGDDRVGPAGRGRCRVYWPSARSSRSRSWPAASSSCLPAAWVRWVTWIVLIFSVAFSSLCCARPRSTRARCWNVCPRAGGGWATVRPRPIAAAVPYPAFSSWWRGPVVGVADARPARVARSLRGDVADRDRRLDRRGGPAFAAFARSPGSS